jgi:PAS domain S-box-containing protein
LKDFYRSIIENMLDAMIIVDWNGCILFANQAAAKVAEMDGPEEARGLNAFDFIHDRSREELLEHLTLIRENIPGALREYRIRTAKGKDRWIEAMGKKIRYKGRFADLVTFREVTRRKKAEEALKESEEKYRLLIDSAHDVIGIFQDGENKVVNRIAQMLSGYPEKELLSFPVEKFIHPGDRETALATFHKIQSAEVFSAMFDMRILTKEGETLWLTLSAIAIIWEGRPAVLYFGRDITKEKKLENQLLAEPKNGGGGHPGHRSRPQF